MGLMFDNLPSSDDSLISFRWLLTRKFELLSTGYKSKGVCMSLFTRALFPLVTCLTLGLFLAVSSPVWAQDGQMGQSKQQQMGQGQQAMQKKMQRMKKIGERLQAVQEETLQENPKLKKKQEELDALVQDTMDQNMADKGISMEGLKSLQSELQSKDLSSEEKQQLQSTWQEKVQSYQQARMKTMRNETVQNKQEDFREDMISAMEKKEPETKSMLQELEQLQQQMRAMRQGMMKGQGGQGQGGQGQ